MCLTFFSCWEIYFSHVLHLSIILSSIASYFITFMHLYGFFVLPWSSLIIFKSLGWSFLASCTLCQSWQKGGEIVENMWFLSKILHVRGRNTCLCKGEMCFILLGGCLLPSSCTLVLWPCLHTLCLSLIYIYIYMMMYVFFTYLYMCCFFSIFIHMFFVLVCNLLFLFHTKMSWWVLFKVFQ